MRMGEQLRFDHEPGDTPHETESLRMFAAMGVELGALVTVWHCDLCDYTAADFDYDR